MPVDIITPATVRNTLRALRYARPLHTSPLVGLDLVTLALSAEGWADARQSRSWALGRCLTAAVEEPLARMRTQAASSAAPRSPSTTQAGSPSPKPPAGLSQDQQLERLVEDLRSGSAERLEWTLVHSRYLSPTHPSTAEVGRALGVTERTVRNRLARGVARLVEELQRRELAATRTLEARPDGPSVERILVDENAAPRSPVELLGQLQALVSRGRPTLRISPEQFEETTILAATMAADPAACLRAAKRQGVDVSRVVRTVSPSGSTYEAGRRAQTESKRPLEC